MDIISMLTKEHRQLEEVFKRLLVTKDDSAKVDLYAELRDEIEAHSAVEERVLYPRLRKMADLRRESERAEEAHLEMRAILHKLDSLDIRDEEWGPFLQELQNVVEYHVRAEEETIFKKMQKHFKDGELRRWGEDLEIVKAKYPEAV